MDRRPRIEIIIVALAMLLVGCSTSTTTTRTVTERVTIDTLLTVVPDVIERTVPIQPDTVAPIVSVPAVFDGTVTNPVSGKKTRVRVDLKKKQVDIVVQPDSIVVPVKVTGEKVTEQSKEVSQPWYASLLDKIIWIAAVVSVVAIVVGIVKYKASR